MLKRNKLLLIVICLLFLVAGCNKEKSDSVKFKEEYSDVEISDNNRFIYKSDEDIIKLIDKKDSLVLFIGSNKKEWSKEIIPMLDQESKNLGIYINYINLDSSTKIIEKLNLTKDNDYLIGIIKGELKYTLDVNSNEEVIKNALNDLAININSCDIDNDGC